MTVKYKIRESPHGGYWLEEKFLFFFWWDTNYFSSKKDAESHILLKIKTQIQTNKEWLYDKNGKEVTEGKLNNRYEASTRSNAF